MRSPITIIYLALFLAACSHLPPTSEIEIQETKTRAKAVSLKGSYEFVKSGEVQLIGPGDLFALSYTNDTKLNGTFRVAFEGTLSLPYRVKIEVTGKSPDEVVIMIRQSYRRFIKNVDELSVNLIERKRYIQITGDVANTGQKLVEVDADPTEILAAKAATTSAEVDAKKNLKFLKIKWKDTSLVLDLRKYFNNEWSWNQRQWRGGEILSFQNEMSPTENEFPVVRVMGDVKTPGAFPYEKGQDFYGYITMAGGLNPSANIDEVQLIRGNNFGRKIYRASLEQLANESLPQPYDSIVVYHNRSTEVERKLQLGATAASIISALTLLIVVF